MPLTQEQFQKAQDAGFSTDQIIEFEKKRTSESPETTGEIISPTSFREKKATGRGGSFDWFQSLGRQTEEKPRDFIGNVQRGMQIPLAGLSGAYSMGESALSDIALGVTERKPQDIPRHLAETFTGKRTSKFSDVAESVGVPEGLPSSTVGLITAFGLSDIPMAGRMTKAGLRTIKGGVKAIGGGINKVIEVAKDGFQTLKGLKLPTTATLEKEQFGIRLAKKARLGQLQESTQKAKYNLNKLKDTTQQIFDNNYKVLSNKLKDASEEGVLNFQKALPEYNKSMFQTYKTWQNEISDTLEITGNKINLNEVNNVLIKAQKEILEEGYGFGQGYNEIENLISKKYQATSSNLTKTFSLQEVKNDISRVFNTVNYQQYGKVTDRPANILMKHWGQLMVDKTTNVYGVSEYQAMQDWYSRNVDAMKLADKLFKPKQGELYAEKGASFLRKFGMVKNPSNAEQKLISMIEQGNELVKGTGNLSEPVKHIGNELRLVKEANQVMKNNIAQRLDKLNITSQQVRRSIAKEFDARIDEYTNKIMDRKKAVALARMLGLGAAGAAGLYGAGRAVTNIAGFRESYGQ